MSLKPTDHRSRRVPPGGGIPVRIVSLAVMLGLVVAAMVSLQQPATVDKLGRAFGLKGEQALRVEDAPTAPSDGEPTEDPVPLVEIDASWNDVKDNAPFRTAEDAAWFALIAAVQKQTVEELRTASLGEATYAQLRAQPDAYRGRVVALRGVVRQATTKRAPANDLGIESYVQLWLEPAGGGQWPLVVYALDLPDAFPLGDQLHEPVTLQAAFFKNWSYSYGDGVGIAPALVAKGAAWQPTPTPAERDSEPSRAPMWGTLLGAAALAGALIAYAMRRSRRPPRVDEGPVAIDPRLATTDVRQELANLSQQDASS